MTWELHALLDQVLARRGLARMQSSDRKAFATAVLQTFALAGRDLEAACHRLIEHVPNDLDTLDMNDLLVVLEEVVPFTWVNDLVTFPQRTRDSLVAACTAILEARERPSPPEPLVNAMLEAFRVALGDQLTDIDTLRGLMSSRIVREVWQCRRGEERALAERIVDDVTAASRVTFE